MLDLGIGPMHFGPAEDQEINTAWQPGVAPWDFQMVQAGYNALALANFASGQIVKYVHPGTGESIAFQPQQLQYTNDLDQIQAIANPQAASAVVQDEDVLFWQGAFGPGFDIRWQTQTARLDKRLIVDQASRWPTPTATIIAGGNPVARLQFIFQVSNGIDIFVNGVLWNRAVNNPVDTQGYVEFRHQGTGEVLWVFNLPRSNGAPVEDQDPDELLGTFRLRRTGPNLFVEHRIPIAWLQAADYPIEIDTTIDEQVGTDNDDVTQNLSGDVTASQAIMDHVDEWYGGRFTTVNIPNSATIDVAYLSVCPTGTTADEPKHDFDFEAADSAAAWNIGTGTLDVSGRTRTGNQVLWDVADLGADGSTFFNTPSLVAGCQAVVDRPGWAANNTMAVTCHQPTTASTRDLGIKDYGVSATLAAKLHIEYTSGIDADVTEAASAADAPSAVLTTLAGVAEAGSAADLQDAAGSIYSAAAAEAGAAVDTPTALLTTLAEVAEPAAAADAQSASLLFQDGVTELASATDAQTALLTHLAAVSEAAAAGDAPSALLTTQAAMTEAAAAADALSAQLDQAAAVTEAGAALEASDWALVTLGGTVEAAAATETQDATVVPAAGGAGLRHKLNTGIFEGIEAGVN
jgi:hypothetical protein